MEGSRGIVRVFVEVGVEGVRGGVVSMCKLVGRGGRREVKGGRGVGGWCGDGNG